VRSIRGTTNCFNGRGKEKRQSPVPRFLSDRSTPEDRLLRQEIQLSLPGPTTNIRRISLSKLLLSRVWHSQITRTVQPSFSRLCRHCRSLMTLALNFWFQKAFRLFGEYVNLQFLCRCQKHPFTKTTVRNLGRTISGQPGSCLTWMRKRKPNRCNKDRTASSGFVSLERILDMFQLRLCFVRRSVTAYRLATTAQSKSSYTMAAICFASNGGTAFPTC
jgi:hypothetical protein